MDVKHDRILGPSNPNEAFVAPSNSAIDILLSTSSLTNLEDTLSVFGEMVTVCILDENQFLQDANLHFLAIQKEGILNEEVIRYQTCQQKLLRHVEEIVQKRLPEYLTDERIRGIPIQTSNEREFIVWIETHCVDDALDRADRIAELRNVFRYLKTFEFAPLPRIVAVNDRMTQRSLISYANDANNGPEPQPQSCVRRHVFAIATFAAILTIGGLFFLKRYEII